MLPHQLEITFVLGFLAQWLRQYPWYADKVHVSLAVLLSLAVAISEAHGFSLTVVYTALQLAQAVLGGTFIADKLSHAVPSVIPKYNSATPQ